jgi:hypothetical protein
MKHRVWAIGAAVVAVSAAWAAAAGAAQPATQPSAQEAGVDAGYVAPVDTSLQLRPAYLADDSSSSMYPQLGPPQEDRINNGGVRFDLNSRYLNNYIYRGIDQSTLGHSPENALQFDTKMSFDLGNLPHPFVGLFVNVFNEDPISRFEEVRPMFGFDWTIKPVTISGGFNSYLFPNRKELDTEEVWAGASLDDSRIFRMEKPLLSPYIYAAYDLAKYQGVYFEVGVRHDFYIENVGVTLSPQADIAYVLRDPIFRLPGRMTDTGFQHYDVGLIGSYSLNTLFNFPHRYGEWSIKGYLYYTDDIANHLRADTRIWGGVGISFSY